MLVELKHLKKMAEAATGGVSLKKVLLKIYSNCFRKMHHLRWGLQLY